MVGAEVAVLGEDSRKLPVFARGCVVEPMAPLASGEEFFGEAQQWRVEWQGKVMGSAETLSTEEVGDARQCRAAIDRGERAVLQRVRDAEQQREKRRAEERSTEESVRPPRTSTYSTAITACYASITTVSFFVILDLTRTTRL